MLLLVIIITHMRKTGVDNNMSFADKVIEYEFDNLCKNHHVRCLRNNIYQSIHVQDFKHLLELWTTHPYFVGDYTLLIKSLRYILIKEKSFLTGRLLSTYGYLFWLTVDMSESELIENIKKNCRVSRHE